MFLLDICCQHLGTYVSWEGFCGPFGPRVWKLALFDIFFVLNVACPQSRLSSNLPVLKVACHQIRLSSNSPVLKFACPQICLSSKSPVLKVVCPQSRLSSMSCPQRRCPQCRCPQCRCPQCRCPQCRLSSMSHRAPPGLICEILQIFYRKSCIKIRMR